MDTLKLVYTQLEAFNLVDEYTEAYKKKIKQLEKENKKLKKERDLYKARDEELNENCFGLANENEKLNIKVASLEGEIKGLNSVIDKLKEENQTLELWLDNKEKVNKSLREELSAYDREYFDEDKKAKNIFMEEDTLQELRDIGEI